MGDFDKKQYDKLYISAKRRDFRISMSKEEHAKFMQFVQDYGDNCTASTYCKRLINADMAKHGLDPIFKV